MTAPHLRVIDGGRDTTTPRATLKTAIAERHLIGAAIQAAAQRATGDDSTPDVIAMLGGDDLAEHFSDLQLGRAWSVLCRLRTSGADISIVSAAGAFRDAGIEWGGGSAVELSIWTDAVAELVRDGLPSLARSYAREIREASARRRVIAELETLADKIRDTPGALADWLPDAVGQVATVVGPSGPLADALHPHANKPAALMSISEATSALIERATAPTEHGVPVPWQGLRWCVGDTLPTGTVTMLAGYPSHGKSSIALELVRHAAKRGRRTLYVALETNQSMVALRMIAQEGRHDASALRKWQVGNEVTPTVTRVTSLPVWITSNRTLPQVVADADKLGGIDFLVVDYLQLLHAPRDIQKRHEQVAYLSRALKDIAAVKGITVLALSSVSVPADKNTSRPPNSAQLRESGQLWFDADFVLICHRPDRQQPGAVLLVDKARDAAIGSVDLAFDAQTVSFTEVAHEHDQHWQE